MQWYAKGTMRTVEWSPEGVRLIDQRQLPQHVVVSVCRTVDEVAAAIRTMQVRGAPAIGACAAYGIALGAQHSRATSAIALLAMLQDHAHQLAATRPTAVNLTWALARVMRAVEVASKLGANAIRRAALAEANAIAEADVIANQKIGANGAPLLARRRHRSHTLQRGRSGLRRLWYSIRHSASRVL